MFLALFYAFGLWLVGLKYGLIIGLLTGFFSFIPYLGMAIGACVGLAVAAFQFQDLVGVALVAGGVRARPVHRRQPDVATRGRRPYPWEPGLDHLRRAGRHVLSASSARCSRCPWPAVLGVLIRFALAQYKASRLYRVPTPVQRG